ncbi:hypothetical protein BDA96_04G344000 [Sorghum bicolor]|uniref:Uncharacterized protein n=2 Tax=Sorghum bicolor TaxID=4558 RepID=A0A921UL54_SORBI|nr:uncharacterized protein LOC8082697 [Sorghum bicolor]EES05909.1 hypothetical protein SORBI_3004G321500 [Sorghum bicolor]KAG0535180.1 hypothetical protein BDA96_04G344000 [Sorghum bicolor]|eukprot:XP_002452933.1 uncharacterized protein LOC8082697 [Sorghum bicolor]
MAIRSSFHGLPSTAAVPRFSTSKSKVTTLRLSATAHSSHEHFPSSSSARSIKTVFEDQVRGVVCYRDDSGEVICEGFDEGPRLGMRLPEKACFPWPMGIRVTDFIELSTLGVLEDEDALK